MKANQRSPPPRGRLFIALAAPATGSGDAGRVCIHSVLRIRGRTYCPKAPKSAPIREMSNNVGSVRPSDRNPRKIHCFGDHLEHAAQWYSDACEVVEHLRA
jgi:hypothetical protein